MSNYRKISQKIRKYSQEIKKIQGLIKIRQLFFVEIAYNITVILK